MRSKTIRLELFKVRKIKNMSQIARETGVTPTMVQMVVNRERKSTHIMKAIAEAIDKPVEQVWPELKRAS